MSWKAKDVMELRIEFVRQALDKANKRVDPLLLDHLRLAREAGLIPGLSSHAPRGDRLRRRVRGGRRHLHPTL